MPGLRMVGFVTNANSRQLDITKIVKILEQKPCKNVKEYQGFLGVYIFYQIWIKDFSLQAELLFRLLKKDVPFCQGQEQVYMIEDLKMALTQVPMLVKLDYSEEAGEIILTIDASLTGQGAVL